MTVYDYVKLDRCKTEVVQKRTTSHVYDYERGDNMPRGFKSINAKTGNMTAKERDQAEQNEQHFKDSLADIKAPAWLETKLKRRFTWYVKQMQELDILTILDASILAQYVYYEDRFLKLDELIQENGYSQEDGKISPFIVEQRQVRGLLDRMEMKLGFNPTDRLRFTQQESEKIDELEQFKNELQ